MALSPYHLVLAASMYLAKEIYLARLLLLTALCLSMATLLLPPQPSLYTGPNPITFLTGDCPCMSSNGVILITVYGSPDPPPQLLPENPLIEPTFNSSEAENLAYELDLKSRSPSVEAQVDYSEYFPDHPSNIENLRITIFEPLFRYVVFNCGTWLLFWFFRILSVYCGPGGFV